MHSAFNVALNFDETNELRYDIKFPRIESSCCDTEGLYKEIAVSKNCS